MQSYALTHTSSLPPSLLLRVLSLHEEPFDLTNCRTLSLPAFYPLSLLPFLPQSSLSLSLSDRNDDGNVDNDDVALVLSLLRSVPHYCCCRRGSHRSLILLPRSVTDE